MQPKREPDLPPERQLTQWQPICVVGGAHLDIAGRIEAAPRMGASNPGTWHRQPGGAGLNTASNIARLGVATHLAGPVGDDADGHAIRAELATRNIIDGLAPLPGHATGAYGAIMAPDGDLIIGLADLQIQEAVDADWLLTHCRTALEPAKCWFLTANLAPAAMAGLADAAAHRLLAAAAVSPAKAPRLRAILARMAILFCNLAEGRALLDAPDAPAGELARQLRQSGVASGVISAGGDALVFWSAAGLFAVRPPELGAIADVHGAGDALAGATLAALARQLPMAEAVCHGIAAAQLTLQSLAPWRHDLDWPMLESRARAIAPAQLLG